MSVEMVALGDVGSFQAGFGFPNKYQGLSVGDYPFAKVGDVSRYARAGKQYIEAASNFVNKNILKEIRAKTIPINTIVFAKIGEAISQNFRAITAVEMLIDNNTMGLIPDEDVVDVKYLYHYLCTIDLYRYTSATTVPALRKSTLETIKIPLPPLKEQKRIAAILDKADAIRRKRQQTIDLTEQLLRSVFLDMFGDPVTNPKGFEVSYLKDIARIQIGPFGTQLHKEDYIEGGIPLINPTHIVNGKVVPKSSLSISEEKHSSLSEYHLAQGDIIMGRRGEMGRCALITEKEIGWMCGTGSLFIRPNITGVFSEYLYTLLSSEAIKHYLEGESLGATMPNLNKGIIGNIRIPVPDEEIINKYSRMRKKYDVFKNRLNMFSDKVLFESLAQQAFNGELGKQTKAA